MAENQAAQQTSRGTGFFAKLKFLIAGLVIGAVLGVGAMLVIQHVNASSDSAEPQIIEASTVFDRIVAQNELVCASQHYSITERAEKTNKIPFTNIKIPLTTSSFWYKYAGTIQAGVDLQTATYAQDGNVVTITLDQPKLTSNTPDMNESDVLEEKNNILNPIHIKDVKAFKKQCKEKSEEEALKGGILDEARVNAENNISDMFHAACGDSLTVNFVWREAK